MELVAGCSTWNSTRKVQSPRLYDNGSYMPGKYNNNNNSFIADSWSISQAQSENTRAQKMVNHSALQNRCLHATTLIGAKHFNSAPTVKSFTHHKTGIQ